MLEEITNPITNTLEASLTQVQQACKLPKYTAKAVTFNLGNNNPSVEVVEDLAQSIIPNHDTTEQEKEFPDLLVFSMQEAKLSWLKGECLAERIIKRLGDRYEILHNSNATALTHLQPWKEPKNLVNWSRTQQVIAYKKSSFREEEISIVNSGKYVEGFDNKGGLYSVVSLHGTKTGIIAAHLDSKNEARRHEQAQELIKGCEKIADGRLDGLIFMGDLNNRAPNHMVNHELLDFNDNNSSASGSIQGRDLNILLGARSEEEFIDEMLTQLENNQHSPYHKFKFSRVSEFTYCQFNEEQKLIPNRARGNTYDAGPLDLVGIRNRSTKATQRLIHVSSDTNAATPKAIVARPKQTPWSFRKMLGFRSLHSPKEMSDHAAVIGKLALILPPNEQQNQALTDACARFEATNTFNINDLRAIHASLGSDPEHKDDLLRWYFSYASRSMQTISANSDNYKSRFENSELAKCDIHFIIEHLDCLHGKRYDPKQYKKLIFEACLHIANNSDDPTTFMLEIFNKLLDKNTACPNDLRVKILKPFKVWLDEHNIQRIDYKLFQDPSTKRYHLERYGIFRPSPPPPVALNAAPNVNR